MEYASCRARRLLALGSLASGLLLLLLSPAGPSSAAQADLRVELEQGQTARREFNINNKCATAHHFRVESKLKHLGFDRPTEAVLIEAKGRRTLGAVFDATDAAVKVHRGEIGVTCVDCGDEPGCGQDRNRLTVEMAVLKRSAAA